MSGIIDAETVVRRVGDPTITRTFETELVGFGPTDPFPGFADVARDPGWFPPRMSNDAGEIRLASHSWPVQGPSGTLLVDTGRSNRRQASRRGSSSTLVRQDDLPRRRADAGQ